MCDPFFEMWLQDSLQRLYDEALAEPVPEDLLKLVAETGNKSLS